MVRIFVLMFILVYLFLFSCKREMIFTESTSDNNPFEQGEQEEKNKGFHILFSKEDEFPLIKKSPNTHKVENINHFMKNSYFIKNDGTLIYIAGFWDGVGAKHEQYSVMEFNTLNNNFEKGKMLDYQKISGGFDWMKLELYQSNIFNNRYVFFCKRGIACIDLEKYKTTKKLFINHSINFIDTDGSQDVLDDGYSSSYTDDEFLYVHLKERILAFNILEIITNFEKNPNYVPIVSFAFGKKDKNFIKQYDNYSRDLDTTLLGFVSGVNNRVIASSKFVFIQNPRGYGANLVSDGTDYRGYNNTISLFDAKSKKMIKEIQGVSDIDGTILGYNMFIISAYDINNNYTMLLLDYNNKGSGSWTGKPSYPGKLGIAIYKNSDLLDPNKKIMNPFQSIEIDNFKVTNNVKASNMAFDIKNKRACLIYDLNDSITNCVLYKLIY